MLVQCAAGNDGVAVRSRLPLAGVTRPEIAAGDLGVAQRPCEKLDERGCAVFRAHRPRGPQEREIVRGRRHGHLEPADQGTPGVVVGGGGPYPWRDLLGDVALDQGAQQHDPAREPPVHGGEAHAGSTGDVLERQWALALVHQLEAASRMRC